MGDIIVQLSILDPLYTLFGWLTRVLFNFFGNYGLAIIFLTIIIRAALIPLNIRSQKSMLKMQALSGKQAELQRQYGDDKEAYQEAFMKMQKENGAGGLSGCLLPFLQLFFIWPIYRIVSGPLIYLSQVSKENIEAMINLGNRFGESGIFEGRAACSERRDRLSSSSSWNTPSDRGKLLRVSTSGGPSWSPLPRASSERAEERD